MPGIMNPAFRCDEPGKDLVLSFNW